MYKHSERQMILPHEFFLPFGGKLDPNNRWCKLASIIPWDEVEDMYINSFKNLTNENKAFSVRTALGSLILQEQEGFSDEQLTENICENPYIQYFIGFHSFKQGSPFDPSLLVHFRKRLGKDIVNKINEMIAKPNIKKDDDEDKTGRGKSSGDENKPEQKTENENISSNAGKLILDASCVPADIHYPTDIWLLNRTRESLEDVIDVLHAPQHGIIKKPRTYRNIARRDYLRLEKNRKPSIKDIRKGIGKQLGYIKRDLEIISKLSKTSQLELLENKKYKNLLVSSEIYRQQLQMYMIKTHKIEDRIVSLHIKDLNGVHELVKELTAGTIQTLLEEELNDELGYAKHDYQNKQTDNSRTDIRKRL